MKLSEVVDFLRFWEAFPERPSDKDDAAKRAARARLDPLSDKALDGYMLVLQRRYDEQQSAADSVATRGGSLFVFVGVLSTGGALLTGLGSWENAAWIATAVVVGALLFYAALAASWLAIRSQQVSVWTTPRVEPEDARSKRELDLAYASELIVAIDRNREVQRNLVAYLRDGQVWARLVLVLVVAMAAISIAAAEAVKQASGQPMSPASPAASATLSVPHH